MTIVVKIMIFVIAGKERTIVATICCRCLRNVIVRSARKARMALSEHSYELNINNEHTKRLVFRYILILWLLHQEMMKPCGKHVKTHWGIIWEHWKIIGKCL